MSPMLAYHGDAEFRARFLAEIQRHQDADQIQRTTYGSGFGDEWRGCAIGCSLHSLNRLAALPLEERVSEHRRYPKELGIPLTLAYLEDRLFEGIPAADARAWPMRFSSAIQAGADLALCWPRFAHWMLMDETAGVHRLALTDESLDAIRSVAALIERLINGDAPTPGDWWHALRHQFAVASVIGGYFASKEAYEAGLAAVEHAHCWAVFPARQFATHSRTFACQADKLVELLAAAPLADTSGGSSTP